VAALRCGNLSWAASPSGMQEEAPCGTYRASALRPMAKKVSANSYEIFEGLDVWKAKPFDFRVDPDPEFLTEFLQLRVNITLHF